MLTIDTLFWFSAGMLVYTYFMFPLAAWVRALCRPRPVQREDITPGISIVIPVFNEAAHIRAKLLDLRMQDYPADRMEILVASDGSTDNTESIARAMDVPGLQVLSFPRRGKNAAINGAVSAATADILVFTDADSLWRPDALRRLVAPFADPTVGGVAGDVRYAGETDGSGGENTYWNLDRRLRLWLGRAGSVTSATGQIYAVRRAWFRSVPPGVIDDFFISTSVVAAGKRLVFEPLAVATHPITPAEREFSRKVRNLAIGFAGVWAMRRLANPVRFGFYAWQFVSHKVLRRLMFAPLAGMAVVAGLRFSRHFVYQVSATAVIALALLGVAGGLLRRGSVGRKKVFALPHYFWMIHAACLLGLYRSISRSHNDRWQPHRPPAARGGEA